MGQSLATLWASVLSCLNEGTPNYVAIFVSETMGQSLATLWASVLSCLNEAPAIENDAGEPLAARRYKALRRHEELFQAQIPLSWIAPELQEIITSLKNAPEGTDPKSVSSQLRQEAFEVFSFPCFTKEFITLFIEEINNFYASGIPARRPNSMNNYGVIVNEIGMRPMITAFQKQYIWPLARMLFPEEGSFFDTHHSFIVRYQAGEDLGLDMHTDDSDVTFNVCLGYEFTGATLTFCGGIGTAAHRKATHVYSHEVGRGVIHLGSRRHGADDIESGLRLNLIVWSHNTAWRQSHPGRRKEAHYAKEEGPPDLVCLSHTHDRDYLSYKSAPVGRASGGNQAWCPPPGKEYDDFPSDAKTGFSIGDL
eukprot:TRINITY_DN23992_c0_g2_i1.p1 TRINITY_DN23992_c0_g2~~TRINITY_DN23992_c0_g2_i1.p1  ORF type:complete len:386 (+),score=62.17 TRINITY_DN23992_c0_g2_i1:62-1159(+)